MPRSYNQAWYDADIAKGAAKGAATGAAAGSFLGWLGSLIGGIIGAGAGLASGYATADKNKASWNTQQDALEKGYKEAYTTSRQNYNDTKTSINQNNSSLSEVNTWLDNYGTYYNQQVGQQIATGKSNYSQLAGNWADSEVLAASRGQLGGSSTLVSEQNKQTLSDYVGSDLMLDDSGGLFGNTITLLKSSLASELSSNNSTHDNILIALYGDGTTNNLGLVKNLEIASNNMKNAKQGVYDTTASEDSYNKWKEENYVG